MNGIALDPTIPTFTEELRRSGYRTHCIGKMHLHNAALPKGIPLDKVDPAEYPEAADLWRSGRIEDFHYPFYGFEKVELAGGHGHFTYGHYLHWLEREHPKEAGLFYDRTPLEPPSGARELFNRSSYKWALPADLHPLSWIGDRSVAFLKNAGLSEDKGATRLADGKQPFCLVVGIQEPHPPFAPPAPYCHLFRYEDMAEPKRREGELADLPPHFRQMYETPLVTSGNHSQSMSATDPFVGECRAHYYGLISFVDDQVGRILQALRDTGLEESTLVIFLADHGECLGNHGLWGKGPYHYDDVVRVPFIISWKDTITPGTVIEEPVELLDLAPTILDAAGIPLPEGRTPPEPEAPEAPPPLPGRRLLPLARSVKRLEDSDALVEMDEDYLGFKMRTLITRRYRLTVYSGHSYGELFDLERDPDELWNLWDKPEHGKIRDELRIRLLDKIISTDIAVPRQMSRA
jgi:arylsulfatase